MVNLMTNTPEKYYKKTLKRNIRKRLREILLKNADWEI